MNKFFKVIGYMVENTPEIVVTKKSTEQNDFENQATGLALLIFLALFFLLGSFSWVYHEWYGTGIIWAFCAFPYYNMIKLQLIITQLSWAKYKSTLE